MDIENRLCMCTNCGKTSLSKFPVESEEFSKHYNTPRRCPHCNSEKAYAITPFSLTTCVAGITKRIRKLEEKIKQLEQEYGK